MTNYLVNKKIHLHKNFDEMKGFSLIELLVVISIIAVLTAVLLMNLVGARERSRDSQKIQNLNELKSALRMYYNDNQSYPGNSTWASDVGSSYMVGAIGLTGTVTYQQTSEGDGFKASVSLENSAGDSDDESQRVCGITPTPGIYMVCSN